MSTITRCGHEPFALKLLSRSVSLQKTVFVRTVDKPNILMEVMYFCTMYDSIIFTEKRGL